MGMSEPIIEQSTPAVFATRHGLRILPVPWPPPKTISLDVECSRGETREVYRRLSPVARRVQPFYAEVVS